LIGTNTNPANGSTTAPRVDVSGLTIYTISSNTHTVIPYYSNIQFKRQGLFVTDRYIYAVSASTIDPNIHGYIRVLREDPTSFTPAFFSTSAFFNVFPLGAQQVIGVGNRLWVVAGSGNNDGNIQIFDEAFNFKGTITLTEKVLGRGVWGGRYWMTAFYDKERNRFYVHDTVGNETWVIQPNSLFEGGTIRYHTNELIYAEGKDSSSVQWSIDPVTNKLYMVMTCIDSPTEQAPTTKTYEIDRVNYSKVALYDDLSFSNLVKVDDGLPNSLVGTGTGTVAWQGGNIWSGDGRIDVYNNYISGFRTGLEIILTRRKYIDGQPTNVVVNNDDPTNTDYIAPRQNTTDCQPQYTTECPTYSVTPFNSDSGQNKTIELQFSQSVYDNPSIFRVEVIAKFNTTIVSPPIEITNTEFNKGYFAYDFPGTTNRVEVKYYNDRNVQIGDTCILNT
jgi:hypothetical protein